MNRELAERPKCGDNQLGYMQWHHDAARRHAKGERQRYCGICSCWTWADLARPGHQTISIREFSEMVRRMEREYLSATLAVPEGGGKE